MIPLQFRRMVEQVVRAMRAHSIVPNSITGSVLTTSGTVELTLVTQTLTAPPVAGQIVIEAALSFDTGTAGDVFNARLYVGGNVVCILPIYVPAAAAYMTLTLVGNGSVSTAADQVIKATVQRAAGSGTIHSTYGAQMSWAIFPGVSTVA